MSLDSSRRYSAQILPEPGDRLRKLAYILLNPVAAQIVRNPREYDQPITIRRPDCFFSDKMPETVELVIPRHKWAGPDRLP